MARAVRGLLLSLGRHVLPPLSADAQLLNVRPGMARELQTSQYAMNSGLAKEAPAQKGASVPKPPKKTRKPTGYNLWVKESHPRVKASNPGKTGSEILSLLAKEYKALSDSQKQALKMRAQAS